MQVRVPPDLGTGPGRRASRARAVSAVAAGTMVAALGGCSAGGGDGATATPTEASPPPGLTATLYQTRMDVAVRQVEIRMNNGTGSEVTLSDVRLRSSGFQDPMPYARDSTVLGAGRVVDLPVALGPPVCQDRPAVHTVSLDYRLADGSAGSVEIPAMDDRSQVEALLAAECFAERVEEVAGLEISGPPNEREVDGVRVADLAVVITPAGAGRLDIGRVGSTTLLQPVDPATGDRLPDGYDVGLTVTGTAMTRFVVSLVPNRCDAHAVAEDKQGTLLPVTVTLDGEQGRVRLVSPPEVTAWLYDFVRRACSP
ncbi:hypothetical protein [Ornithinimicrobium cerasi]|uniref:hypothetical protein n=1 Tax=Ornithinimicrobium cerasi TaxID=2248773 RepID=UPI00137A6231|nr:hypothetical protein [Ornithinimicrobium cerasi]